MKNPKFFLGAVLAAVLLASSGIVAQQDSSASGVPSLVNFSGVLKDSSGRAVTGVVGLTFLIYKDSQGGAPLWLETQNVSADGSGHYSVLLGSTKAEGLPTEMFASEQARWIGVQVSGQAEQPRVLLVSAPYALKAGDAETLGGLPASAFMLAAPRLSASSAPTNAPAQGSTPPPASSNVTTTGGTVNAIPLFSTATNIQNSVITQTGSGATAKIGIGVANPAAALDIKGGEYVRGVLTLPASGVATATKGANSQAEVMIASAFNSGTATAVNQKFQLQAEPAGNDTTTASGSLDLLYGSGTAAPAETGLKINNLGQITFASGQIFPGTGPGSVTSVASGAGLAGGPITSSGTLSIASGGVTNAMLANPSLSVTAGTGLTGGGAISLGGSTTLNVDTTKIPQLAAANFFAGNQAVTGNVTASGEVQGGVVNATNSFDIGGTPFAFGSYTPAYNVFVGFAGNTSLTGIYNVGVGLGNLGVVSSGTANTAVGLSALPDLTMGGANTGLGANALFLDNTGGGNTGVGASAARNTTSGSSNTAVGENALYNNATGSSNTALGFAAGPDAASTNLSNSTAIGALATVSAPNALVLGQTTAGTPGKTWVNVGIGTAVPGSTLEAYVTNTTGLGPTLTLTNGGIGGNVSSSLDFNTYPPAYRTGYNPGARIMAIDDGHYSSNLVFFANTPGGQNNGLQSNLTITSGGLVDVNGQLSVGNTANFAGAANFAGFAKFTGRAAIGPAVGDDQLSVFQSTSASDAFGAYGVNSAIGSAHDGGLGVTAQGGNGDPTVANQAVGGDGIDAYAGAGPGGLGYAGFFSGDLDVTGAITAGTKDFKIDHPLDPANKYLYHASVESYEMLNIYTGNVTTDAQGEARVDLPNWFEAVNTDFRYQLTVIGQFAQAIVSSEVAGHRFSIETDKPNVKVSWQITGVRQDAFAKANPLVVERQKNARERGHYIHPELYGAPEEQSIAWARHPEAMKTMQEARTRPFAEPKKEPTPERAATQPLAVPPALAMAHQRTTPVAVVKPASAQRQTTPRK